MNRDHFPILMTLILLFFLTGSDSQARADGVAFEFDTDGDPEGWIPQHSVSSLTVSGGTLQFQVTGSDPYVVSPAISVDATGNPYLVIRMSESFCENNQVYWSTEDEPQMDENKKVVFESGEPNDFHLYVLDMSGNEYWQSTITRFRIDPGYGTSGDVEIDYVRICAFEELDPILEIESFAASDQVLIGLGESFPISADISNGGGQALHNVVATITLPAGFELEGPFASQALGDIAGGESASPTWTARADQAAAGVIRLTVDSDEADSVSTYARVFVSPPIPNDSWTPFGGIQVTQSGDTVQLGNDLLRAVFLESDLGFGACAFDVTQESEWRRMAVMPSFSFLAVDHGGAVERMPLYLPQITVEDNGPDVASVRFSGNIADSQGHQWSIELRFSTGSDEPVIDVSYAVTTSAAESLVAFEGPMIYTGAGEFGGAKDAAVFPGLEWLVDDEVSSSTLDITSSAHVRYVPHPNKITVPAMALSWEGAAVGLLWAPSTSWHSSSAKPSAVFAVPDTFERKDAGLMGLFVPSVPDYVTANTREAKNPYPLGPGETVSLDSEIALVCPADGPLAVQDTWYEREGAPEVLPYPHGTAQDELKLSMDAFLDALWIPDEQQWNIYLGGGSVFDVQGRPVSFMLMLELAARLVDDPSLSDSYRARYAEALAAGASTTSYELPFYVGDPATAVHHLAGPVVTLLDQQWSDGSWRFDADLPLELMPGETMGFLGPDEAAELGTCAANALQVLKFARLTGDVLAAERGLLALEFMKQFELPRAAQVWEVPVHTPDVYAAALGCRAFLEGYLFTGRADLLEEAVKWARAGLPFIYVWREDAYPCMLYGSIPVFGASMYANSWFGRLVQWNGLELAYAMLRLAPYDNSYDWDTIGTGILVSAMYQQREDTEYRGTYPDAYNVIYGTESAPYISPARVLTCLLTTMGWNPMPRTVVVEKGGSRVHVSSGADLEEDTEVTASDAIGLLLSYMAGETTYTLVAGITEPDSVERDGVTLERVDDLDSVASGWRYHSYAGLASIKVTHGVSTASVLVRGVYPRNVRLVPEERNIIAFHFDEDGDFEGWNPSHDFDDPMVSGGAFRAISSGNDPYMVHSYTHLTPDQVEIVTIRMRTTTGSAAQFFWTNTEATSFSESNSQMFSITSDGEYHMYSLDLSAHSGWSGQDITGIRLDPTVATDSEIDIDFIIGGVSGDIDGDGILGATENMHGLDRYRYDSDRDGMSDCGEYQLGLDLGLDAPFLLARNGDILGDSDDPFLPDGVPDGDNDTDGDGTINRIELEQGTNPFDGLEWPDSPSETEPLVGLSAVTTALSVLILLWSGAVKIRRMRRAAQPI